jgi:uncharacterized membrane protein
MKTKVFIGILLIFIIAVSGCTGSKDTGAVVSIPLSDVSTTVQFYTFTDNGVDITYFAVLGSDGDVRTAFDACDICGGYKGYEQQGTDIRCRNCGRVFAIDGIGTKNNGYGCWPSYLSHEVNGNNILIRASDLKNSRSKFN